METPSSPTAAVCPPHHWGVVEAHGTQQWTCYRCAAVREQVTRDPDFISPHRMKQGSAWRSGRGPRK